ARLPPGCGRARPARHPHLDRGADGGGRRPRADLVEPGGGHLGRHHRTCGGGGRVVIPGRRLFVMSARQADPLTWFTGPLVPLVFGGVGLLHGVAFAIATWGATPAPWLQIVGVLCCTAA